MDKRLLFFMILLFVFTGITNAQSQLEGKKFEAGLMGGNPVHLQFKDTRYVLSTPDLLVLLRGYFEAKGDTITFKDVSGPMACKPGQKGIYTFTYKNGEFRLKLIKEECEGRQAIAGYVWKEVENKKQDDK